MSRLFRFAVEGWRVLRRHLQPFAPADPYPVTSHENVFVVRRALLRRACRELKQQP